jgi:hypothetical protein
VLLCFEVLISDMLVLLIVGSQKYLGGGGGGSTKFYEKRLPDSKGFVVIDAQMVETTDSAVSCK